jgi:ribulose-phosphate 3-epimerase
MVLIEASILDADLSRLGQEAREAEQARVDGFQIDVMDGLFVPNITFGPNIVRALHDVVKVRLDLHLMIVQPERYLKTFKDGGTARLIVHQEACVHLHRVLQSIRELELEAGVALNPATPLEAIEEVFGTVDVIQIMTVDPGFGGQPFIESQLGKIGRLHKTLRDRSLEIPIAVDGGINAKTAPLAVKSGASILVSGSSIYNRAASVSDNVAALRTSVSYAMPERYERLSTLRHHSGVQIIRIFAIDRIGGNTIKEIRQCELK